MSSVSFAGFKKATADGYESVEWTREMTQLAEVARQMTNELRAMGFRPTQLVLKLENEEYNYSFAGDIPYKGWGDNEVYVD